MARRVRRQVTEPPVTPLRLPRGIRTVVVYGGMFDPPHVFHTVTVPELVGEAVGEDSWVLFVPAARSPFKPGGAMASEGERIAMLRLAVGQRAVWTDECDRAKWLRARGVEAPSYTVDTLRRLRSILPRGVRMRLLIGADQAAEFHKWKSARAVVRLAEPLVIARRPIATAGDLRRAMDSEFWSVREREAWGERMMRNRVRPTSSTAVRKRLAGGAGDRYRDLADGVARYIERRGLYGVSGRGMSGAP